MQLSSTEKVSLNPLYGYDINFKTLTYAALVKTKETNKKVKGFVLAALQSSPSPIPTSSVLNVALLRFLNEHLSLHPTDKPNNAFYSQLRQSIYVEKVFAKLITDRVADIESSLKDFIEENGTTAWIEEILKYLNKKSDWEPVILKEQRPSKVGVKELKDLSKLRWGKFDDKFVKEMLMEAVYESKENHKAFTKLIQQIANNPKLLKPIVKYLNKEKFPQNESENSFSFTCMLSSEKLFEVDKDSILRNYIPQGEAIHQGISVKEIPLAKKMLEGDVAEKQKKFFADLFQSCHLSDYQEEAEKLISGKSCAYMSLLSAGTIEWWSTAD
jgi:hypothetical protein